MATTDRSNVTLQNFKNCVDFDVQPVHTAPTKRGQRGQWRRRASASGRTLGSGELRECEVLREDHHARNMLAAEKSREKEAKADKKSFLLRGHTGGDFNYLRGSERIEAMARQALSNRGPHFSRKQWQARKEVFGDSPKGPFNPWDLEIAHRSPDGSFNVKSAVARFKRTGDLPDFPVEFAQGACGNGIDAGALKGMIRAMLLKSGVEPNPGPPTHGVNKSSRTMPFRAFNAETMINQYRAGVHIPYVDPAWLRLITVRKGAQRSWAAIIQMMQARSGDIEKNPGPGKAPAAASKKPLKVQKPVDRRAELSSLLGRCGCDMELTIGMFEEYNGKLPALDYDKLCMQFKAQKFKGQDQGFVEAWFWKVMCERAAGSEAFTQEFAIPEFTDAELARYFPKRRERSKEQSDSGSVSPGAPVAPQALLPPHSETNAPAKEKKGVPSSSVSPMQDDEGEKKQVPAAASSPSLSVEEVPDAPSASATPPMKKSRVVRHPLLEEPTSVYPFPWREKKTLPARLAELAESVLSSSLVPWVLGALGIEAKPRAEPDHGDWEALGAEWWERLEESASLIYADAPHPVERLLADTKSALKSPPAHDCSVRGYYGRFGHLEERDAVRLKCERAMWLTAPSIFWPEGSDMVVPAKADVSRGYALCRDGQENAINRALVPEFYDVATWALQRRWARTKPGVVCVRSGGLRYFAQSTKDERILVGRNAERLDTDHIVEVEKVSVTHNRGGLLYRLLRFIWPHLYTETTEYHHVTSMTLVVIEKGEPAKAINAKMAWAGKLNLDSAAQEAATTGATVVARLYAIKAKALVAEQPLD